MVTKGKPPYSTAAAVVNPEPAVLLLSNVKKPLYHYVNLCRTFLSKHASVELSAIGMAVSTAVTVSEMMKKDGLATVTRIHTSTVDATEAMWAVGRGGGAGGDECCTSKTKIEVTLTRTENFEHNLALALKEAEYGYD